MGRKLTLDSTTGAGALGHGGNRQDDTRFNALQQMLPDFGDAVCFLENVYEQVKEPSGMLRMQLQLLRALTCEGMSATVLSTFQGAYMLLACLCLC